MEEEGEEEDGMKDRGEETRIERMGDREQRGWRRRTRLGRTMVE